MSRYTSIAQTLGTTLAPSVAADNVQNGYERAPLEVEYTLQ
jgi:hypothetical protein